MLNAVSNFFLIFLYGTSKKRQTRECENSDKNISCHIFYIYSDTNIAKNKKSPPPRPSENETPYVFF